ncbi:unnamed protein product [Ilex paraguariensis]|uniref:TF-B3 domain-containing protein n=1 Tax=Ilex paraguariensis TaxID=185542 RepID=A0ABC8RM06_9AQUA
MEGHLLCFEKKLSPTDTSKNLQIPRNSVHLPRANEEITVTNQDGEIWQFICSTRADGRRHITHEWREFAKAKRLLPGDIFRLYQSTTNENLYFMQIECRSIQLFGVTIQI